MESIELYHKYLKGNHWEKHPTIYADEFVDFLNKNNLNGKVLDTGCGTGKDSNVFYQRGFDIIGVDKSNEEIEKAKQKYPQIKFEVQDIENMRFKDNEIDAIFCINVIHYVKKEKAIKEFLRILKPKGFLYIHFNIEIKDKDGNIDYSQKEEDILKLIKEFRIIKKEIINRTDTVPIEHYHKFIKLILQKK